MTELRRQEQAATSAETARYFLTYLDNEKHGICQVARAGCMLLNDNCRSRLRSNIMAKHSLFEGTPNPNLFDEIARLQRANLKRPPQTPVKRAAKVLAAAAIKTRRPVERPLFPGTSRNPERNPVKPKVPGTRDRIPRPVPEFLKQRFPHARDFS